VAFSPDGKLVASASSDKTVRLWDSVRGTTRYTLSGHSDGVYSVVFSPDGKLLASETVSGTIRLWDTATGGCATDLKAPYAGPSTEFSNSHMIRSSAASTP
jgi:WD40 repeat protein